MWANWGSEQQEEQRYEVTYHTYFTWGNIPGSPRFSVLQATKSWAGPGNEASR